MKVPGPPCPFVYSVGLPPGAEEGTEVYDVILGAASRDFWLQLGAALDFDTYYCIKVQQRIVTVEKSISGPDLPGARRLHIEAEFIPVTPQGGEYVREPCPPVAPPLPFWRRAKRAAAYVFGGKVGL